MHILFKWHINFEGAIPHQPYKLLIIELPLIKRVAVIKPTINPLQAAVISNPKAFVHPTSASTY